MPTKIKYVGKVTLSTSSCILSSLCVIDQQLNTNSEMKGGIILQSLKIMTSKGCLQFHICKVDGAFRLDHV